jgi:lipopolysaccharide export LptBFGC system permease protein LptF
MKAETLKKFKRWYSVVVMALILAFLIAAYVNYGKPASFLFGCFAVLSALMLVVTNMVVKQMLPKEKPQFRTKKNK